MSNEWYVEVDNTLYGPYSQDELLRLATMGRVNPDHRVKVGQDGEWVRAETVNGLFRFAGEGDNQAVNDAWETLLPGHRYIEQVFAKPNYKLTLVAIVALSVGLFSICVWLVLS